MNRRLILHPFLFAAYPVIALLAFNIDQVAPWDALRSLLLVLASSLILMLFFQFVIIKNWPRSALLVSLSFFLFFFLWTYCSLD